MEQKQRFSLRKYKLGLASVLLGTIFLGGALASSEVAFAAENGEETVQTTPDAIDQPAPVETGSQETSVEPTVENKVAETTVAETTASGANAQTSPAETPAAPASEPEDRASESNSTTDTEKNLDNQTPQAADKLTVEPSATLEKDKNYYEASKFDGNKVLELTDVSTTSNQNIDLTSDLDKIKALDSATIYIEFKPKEGQSGTYSLFSASSATNRRSYYAVGVTNGSTPFVGAPNQGSQMYGGELKSGSIDPKVWNSIAVSINRTSADGAGRIDVYFNGKSAFFSSRAGKFLKDFTDLTNMQLGRMNNGGNNIWGGNVDYRNFTIYNKALTAAEVAERSQVFSRDAVTSDAVDEDGRLLTARDEVFVRSQLPRGTFRIPALVKMQDGTLVAGADQRNTGQADYGDIEMTVRTSDDNGKTWGNKVTIFNPQNNPALGDGSTYNPTVIDIALADGNNGKLYAMYDLFPEGHALFGGLKKETVYKEINGVRYQIITKGDEEYTIRENGKVFDAAGKETNYSVVVDAKDKDHAYQDYGDIYEGSNKIGNILFKTGNKDGFQAINTSYLMLSESSDNGKTWSAPRNISDMVRTDDMIFQGTGPGAGITMKHGNHAGRIIFPTYTTGLGRGGEHASLVYSDDQGKTWHTSDMIFPARNNSETSIVELQNGALKAFMRAYDFMHEATSLDGGVTWINQKTTDRYSNRTQISAVTTIQDGKEYVLLSTPGASRRIDGFISVGEVQADNSIKWVKQRQIETGIYGYSSIADLGNGEFGVLYEHGGREAGYPEDIYYRKLNWKFLMEDPVISQVNATQSALTNQADVIALSYSDGVVASEDLVLKLSNGRTLPFIGQKDGKTLLFKWDKEADQGATVVGVETGSLDSLNNYKLDPTASLPYTLEPKESTETLPFDTYYKGDENLDYGSEHVEAGKVGQKVTTTTYTLDANGKVIEKVTTVVTNPVAQAIVKGTKPTTTNQETVLPTRYEADEDFAYGERNEVAGTPKVETTTTTYEVDATTGAITPTTTTTTTDPGRATVVFVGTKPTTQETNIESPIRYEAKADKDFGSANETVLGEPGTSTVTTTYTVNPTTGEVTATAGAPVITKPATTTVIYVGTKPTVTTESVPFSTDYVADESLAYGKSSETAGVAGEKTITTIYKLEGDKAVVDAKSEQVTIAAQNRLVKLGTKPSVETKELDFATEYVADETAVVNAQTVTTPGVKGSETTTTTYKLDGDHVVVDQTTTATKTPINQVISVGTKPTETTASVPFSTEYVADTNLAFGERQETAGQNGVETTTTTYKLENGRAVQDKVTTVQTQVPVNKQVKIGNIKVETTTTNPETVYEPDSSLSYGAIVVASEGKAGQTVTTTTYQVDASGNLVNGMETVTTTPAENRVIRIGNIQTSTSPIAVETVYEDDSDNFTTSEIVVTAGQAGEETTTLTYQVNPTTGELTNPVTSSVTSKEMVKRIIKRGTLAVVAATENELPAVEETSSTETVDLPFTTRYEADENLDYGTREVRVSGQAGKQTTTRHTATLNGEVVAQREEVTSTTPAVEEVIVLGTKPKTETVSIASPVRYEADAAKDFGSANETVLGQTGESTVTTTYTVDATTGEVTATVGEALVTKEPTETIVKIGTKPTVTTATVPFSTDYVADENLAYGEQSETAGVVGENTVTTTYTVNADGTVTAHVGEPVQTNPPVTKVVKIGTKAETTTTDVDYTTSYVADATLDYGKTAVRTPGVKGQSTTTTTYKLDGEKAVVDTTTTTQTTAPTNEVIAVGTKATTTTADVDYTTTYVADATLDYGKTAVRTLGVKGQSTTTTTYKLDGEKAVVDTTTTTQTTAPTAEVIAVGTKPTTTTVDVDYTTSYVADDTIDNGQIAVRTPGVKGTATTTTTYKLDGNQAVVDNTTTTQTTAPTAEVIAVGTKPTTTTADVDYTTTYVADDTLAYGKTVVRTPGVKGQSTTTTTYKLDGNKAVVDKTSTAQTTDPTVEVIAVGTKATTTTADVDYTTSYVADDTLDYGQTSVRTAGVKGQSTTTTTYKLDGNKAVVDKTTTTQTAAPTAEVIAVGTKPTTTTADVDFETTYAADATLAYGKTTIRTPGVKGVNTTTTTYKLDGNKAVVDNTTTTQTTAPTAEVIAVGTKPTTTTADVDYTTTYVADDTLAYGKTTVRTEGKKGTATITTTYKLDGNQAVVDNTTMTQTTVPTAEVIAVGTKPTTTTVDVDYTTRYVADDTLAYGKTTIRTPGVKGQSTTTTTYKLDGNKAVVDKTTTTQTAAPTAEVIAVGTKPTTTTADVDFETTYAADATLAYGKTTIRTPGVKGQSTTTTTYKLDGNQAVEANKSTTQTTAPTAEVIAVGTKPMTTTADVDYTTSYVADATLAYGQTAVRTQGVKGQSTTTTTYKLDGNKAVVDNTTTTQTTTPTNEVIAVGTKPTTTTADVDYTTTYVADDTLAYGKTTVRTEGKKGTATITTTYKLDGNQAVVDNTTTTQTTPPTAEVMAVGNVQTSSQPIAIVTRNVNDDTLEAGQTRVVEEGKAGVLTTVTTYTVNPTTGALENGQSQTTETVKMVERVVAVGTKVAPTETTRRVEVRTEILPFSTEHRENPALDKGVEREVQAGVNGSYKVVRDDVYQGDTLVKTGTEFETDRIAPVTRIIEVGTKEAVIPVETTRRVEVRTEVLPFTTERRENAALNKGVEREVQSGRDGSYKVVRDDVYQGDTLVKTGTEFATDRIAPVTRIIEVGTKEVPAPTTRRVEVRTETIPFTTERRENPALDKGVEREVQSGVNGSYKVVRDDVYEGDTLVKTGTEFATDRIAPVTRIIEVGTKETPVQTTRRVEVRTETLPFTTERRANAALDKGVEREVQAGVNGSYKVVRDDIYEGDTLVKTGTEFETDRIAPVTRIIEVGTKETPVQTTRRIEIRTEVLPFTTEHRENAALDKGVEREVQSGVNGSYKVVRDDVYQGDTLVKTGTEYTIDRMEPVIRIIEVGTKEVQTPTNPTIPVVTDVRPATPEEIKQLEDLKDQLKREINQSNLPQDEKDRFLTLIDQAVAKDQLMTQVHNRQVTVSLDNSQVQAARLVVRELQGAEAREVATTVERQLDNQTVLTSYDIHLVDQNDQVVTNNGETRAVTIAIAKSDDETLSVYYVNGDQLEEMPSIYQNGQLTFFTDHFSVYSIVRTAQTKGNTNSTPTQTSVDVANPESEETVRPVPVQASRPTQATLPNTGENEQEAGQLVALGAGLLSLLGLAWVKRQKKDQA